MALAEAAGRLEIQAAAPLLFAQLKGDARRRVRMASLRALQALKVASMDEAMKVAVADSDATVRRAALTTLAALPTADAGEGREPDVRDPQGDRSGSAGRLRGARHA